MRQIILVFIILSFNATYCQNSHKIIYEADSEGKVISGDLDNLLQHVQNGNPIRVGWVLKFKHPQTEEIIEMQHWADAGFITTLKGHIFAQIHSIYQQGPSPFQPPSIFLTNDQPNGWVAIVGTTGVLRQKYKRDEELYRAMLASGQTEEDVNQQLREGETMKVRTKWAVSTN